MAANRDLRGLPGHMRDAVIGHGIDFVRVEQPDLRGVARSKLVTVEHLADIVETGLNFPLPPLALDLQCEAVGGRSCTNDARRCRLRRSALRACNSTFMGSASSGWRPTVTGMCFTPN